MLRIFYKKTLFLKYQSDFEKNPRSRVFAPLAEAYRKLGMTDKAMEILSQGIRFHPSYAMGYLGLAFCYYDIRQFNLAYSTLRPIIEGNRDNLRLQKLFSDVCLELGQKEEALETLKYLLFVNPRDKEVGELVLRLEKEIEERYRPQHKPIIIPEKELTSENELFKLDKLKPITGAERNDFDDWMTIDLNQEIKNAPTENKKLTQLDSNFDQWNVKKGNENFTEANKEEIIVSEEPSRNYQVHLDLEDDEATENTRLNPEDEDSTPLVTHTLVDLYCGQGHIEKALEVLEKILLLNPHDKKTIQKIKEIQTLVQPLEQYDELSDIELEPENSIHENLNLHLVESLNQNEVSEEEGRRHLMSLIDEKLGPIEIDEDHAKVEAVREISEKLSLFLKKIQKRALDYQSRV